MTTTQYNHFEFGEEPEISRVPDLVDKVDEHTVFHEQSWCWMALSSRLGCTLIKPRKTLVKGGFQNCIRERQEQGDKCVRKEGVYFEED